MFNKVIMMGRIVNDPELKTTPNGVSTCSFRIAVDRRFQQKGEEKKSDFFNVTAWRQQAEFVRNYFAKGRMILVEGELQTRAYTDKNGKQIIEKLTMNRMNMASREKAGRAGTSRPLSTARRPFRPLPQQARVQQPRTMTTHSDGGYNGNRQENISQNGHYPL